MISSNDFKFLIDSTLPSSLTAEFAELGLEARHAGVLGLPKLTDVIWQIARSNGFHLVTADPVFRCKDWPDSEMPWKGYSGSLAFCVRFPEGASLPSEEKLIQWFKNERFPESCCQSVIEARDNPDKFDTARVVFFYC